MLRDTFGSTSNTNCTGTTYSNLDLNATLNLGQYNVAKKIAARRQQEELAAAVAIELQVARALRNLYPGRLISVDELDVSLRIVGMEQVPLSGMSKISCIEDFYGIFIFFVSHLTIKFFGKC